jgi:YidC/Oxa1 family membrane protein insertase
VDNRRLFVAAFLSLAVLVAWQFLFPAPEAAPPEVAPAAPIVRVEPKREPLANASSAAPGEATPLAPVGLPPAVAAMEERPVIETDLLRAEFSNRGATLLSFRAKGQGVNETAGLELIRERGTDPYPFAVMSSDGAALPLNDALFLVERSQESGEEVLAFRYSGPNGAASKTFRFREDGTFRVEVVVLGQPGWGLLLGPGLRNLDAEDSKSQFARRSGVYGWGADVEVVDAQGAEEATALPTGLAWVGLQDTYFLTALIPDTPLASAVLVPTLILAGPGPEGSRFAALPPKAQRTKEQKDLSRDLSLTAYPAGERLAAHAYFGAKQFDRLASVGAGLERTIDWGMFGFLARFFRTVLQKIYDSLVANYGWAIVLMTVVIKIVLLPLTHKSYVSMKKMQELNPKITAIKERWRTKLKDKQGKPNLEAQRKMQEEMNALFKAEGASPISGCLPIVLQMPILFAFYSLLSIAVELRGAPWILWIQDLSAADPYYVLPIVMGATQLIQQRMMPQAGDPIQRRLFQLMPILFTVLFLGFPAGLVLYWLVNNVLSIAQQGVYNHFQKRQAAA